MSAPGPLLKIAVNPWTGSALDAQLAKILLEEKLGYCVELVAIDEYAQFPALANGDLSATMEVWPSGHAEDHRLFIEQQRTVEDLGPLGVVGKIGWYIPTYLLQRDASLATWEGIKAHTDLFKTAASGDSGQLLEGDPTWFYRDQEIISNLGLNLKIEQTGSEAALLTALESAYSRQEPVLFYFWTPHSIHAKYELTEVQLPAHFDGCADCEYPSDNLYKAVWAKLSQTAPAAHRLLKNLTLNTADQIAMLADVHLRGKTVEAATRDWLAQNSARWSAWLDGTGSKLPAIPIPANSWAAKYLFVLDKDTNSVFLGANDLFLSSIRLAFPGIQTLNDLVGHDDFHFYPTALAEAFRADDRQVMDSGVALTKLEVNEPIGGVRTVVEVTKVPLRDENNRVIGLRAIWHSGPLLEVRRSAAGVQVSFPDDASIFRLESNAAASPDGWAPLSAPLNSAGGRLTLEVPTADSHRYFRAALHHPVKIGALVSLTGGWSSLGRNIKAALEIGLDAVNLEELSSGSGLHFSADIRDTKLDPDTALSELQSLAATGVQIVIGPQSSAEVRLLKPFADAHGILLVSPGSTASSLSLPDDNVFRFCPDDSYEVEAMTALLAADGIEAVVPAWRDDAGNQGLHDSLARLFPAQNRVIYSGVKYDANETDFSLVSATLALQVAAALGDHPGKVAVYLAGFDEVTALFRAAKTNPALASVNWYGSDGVVQSQALLSDTVAAAFAGSHLYPCPTFGLDDHFAAIWKSLSISIKLRSTSDVDAFALAAYDAFRVAVLAYRRVTPESSFSDLRSAFLQASTAYIGATGPTLLNAANDRAGGDFDFWSIKAEGSAYLWFRSASFTPDPADGGTISRYP
jgi:ABC-type proline/glycine betaine transport system substrate-binding protein/ABC-type branched-subunit amino acid transport system substrate-binding protein